MYTVLDYGRMAADSVRVDAYASAIARVVRPGDVVLDLGSGTGIFALLAAKAGARRVHAVDPNPAVHLVRAIAEENGYEGIVVHDVSSLDLELPERADVIISDLRGTTPLHEPHLQLIADARRRHLAPGGRLLPLRDRLFVAAVESADLDAWLAQTSRGFGRFGWAAKAAETAVRNAHYSDAAHPIRLAHVATTHAPWAELDYARDVPPVLEGSVELAVARASTLHGLAVWFEATLADDVAFATTPGVELAYHRAFFPLAQPEPVAAGDRLAVTLRAAVTGSRWAWDTRVEGKFAHRQATFLGTPTSPAALLRASSAHRPVLASHGERAARILRGMDGTRTVRELGDDLDEVRELVARYAV